MKTLFGWFYLLTLVVLCTTPALAQDATLAPLAPADPPWLPMLLGAIAALLPSILNTFVDSNTWYGKIIGALSLAVGKAKVDPNAQK